MSPSGWVKLHRKSLENTILQNFDEQGVWDKLMMMAARRQTTARLNGLVVRLERGQVAVSASRFAEQGGITRKRLRTILGSFVANDMIKMGQAKGHAFTVITICNYDLYQRGEDEQGQANGQPRANQGPTKGQAGAKLGPTEQEVGESENQESLAGRPESSDPQEARGLPACFDRDLIDRLRARQERSDKAVPNLEGALGLLSERIGSADWIAVKVREVLDRADVGNPIGWVSGAVKDELKARAERGAAPDHPPPKPPDGFLGRAARLGFDPGRLGAMGVQVWERIAEESDAGRLDDEGVRAALAWCERHGGRTWRPGAAGQGSGA